MKSKQVSICVAKHQVGHAFKDSAVEKTASCTFLKVFFSFKNIILAEDCLTLSIVKLLFNNI